MATADPDATVVALSGDYDFQFMIEELAVGAQFNIPYIHVLVNNAYLGLIRQSQRGFDMDYCVQLSFDNINAPEVNGYGVDHVKVAEGLGCKAIRVFEPARSCPALEQAKKMIVEHRVPVVVEVILERVTNVSMGLEIDNVTEFEELAESGARRPDRALRQPRLTPGDAEMPRVLLAPDKFKGTLTAAEVAEHLADGHPLASPGRRDRHRAGRRRRRRAARRVRVAPAFTGCPSMRRSRRRRPAVTTYVRRRRRGGHRDGRGGRPGSAPVSRASR